MPFRPCPSGCGRFLSADDGHDCCLQCLGIQHAEDAFVDVSCACSGRMSMISLRSRLSFMKGLAPSAATRAGLSASRGSPADALGNLRVTVRASPPGTSPRTSYSSNQIKSNHFYCHITTAQVPWWVKFLWACSRQCKKKTTNNLHMDRQCKKKKKLHWSIYSAPDSAKKTTTTIYIWTDSAKKQQTIYIWTDSAKKLHWSIYSAPDSAKKQQQFTYGQYIFTDCTEDNVQNTHTYTQYT